MNPVKVARKRDNQPLAYSFETEAECLAVPPSAELVINEYSPQFFMGYRTLYIGTAVGWQKVAQALDESPIITDPDAPVDGGTNNE